MACLYCAVLVVIGLSACISEQEILSRAELHELSQPATTEVQKELTEVYSSTTVQPGWCSAQSGSQSARRASRQGVIHALSINQGLQIPLYLENQEIPDSLPVIVGREALVEVQVQWFGFPAKGAGAQLLISDSEGEEETFVQLMATNNAPEGAGRMTTFLSEVQPAAFQAQSNSRASAEVIGGQDDALLVLKPLETTSYFLTIPPNTLKLGSKLAVSLFEEGECDEMDGIQGSRYPAAGMLSLPLRETGDLEVMIVPIRYWADQSGRLPDLDEEDLDLLRGMVEAMFPVPNVSFQLHEIVDTQESDISSILTQVMDLRAAESPPANVAYFGFVNPAESMNEYCGENCVAGVSAVGNASGNSSSGVGVGFRGKAHETFLHELGHILQLNHAPCGEPDQVDQAYPHIGGTIGVDGYDHRDHRYLPASGESRDFMSYCDPSWVSDYHYKKLVESIALTNGLIQADVHKSGRVEDSESVYFAQDSQGVLKKLTAWHASSLTHGKQAEATLVLANGNVRQITLYAQEISEEAGFIFEINEADLPQLPGEFIQLPSGQKLNAEEQAIQPFTRDGL